jgi:hypothetical protein
MIEFIGPLYNLLHSTIFDWTLLTSDLATLIHCSWSQSHSLLYSLGSDLMENTSIAFLLFFIIGGVGLSP